MISYVRGNILDSECRVIAHGCNCLGVMGKGVAKSIVARYPEVFPPYKRACQNYTFRPGKIQTIKCHDDRIIINCATQVSIARHKGEVVADKQNISMCLSKIFKTLRKWGEPTLAIPKIGSGLGGLSWDRDITPILNEISSAYGDIDVIVYDFDN